MCQLLSAPLAGVDNEKHFCSSNQISQHDWSFTSQINRLKIRRHAKEMHIIFKINDKNNCNKLTDWFLAKISEFSIFFASFSGSEVCQRKPWCKIVCNRAFISFNLELKQWLEAKGEVLENIRWKKCWIFFTMSIFIKKVLMKVLKGDKKTFRRVQMQSKGSKLAALP